MSCPTCGGPTVWRGSLSRGKMACDACDPYSDDRKAWHPQAGLCSPTLRRYYDEVTGWHRDWCAARKAVAAGKAKTTDPNLCTCGHTQQTPYSDAQIEQFEIANYGVATMRQVLPPVQPDMLGRLRAVKMRNDYRRAFSDLPRAMASAVATAEQFAKAYAAAHRDQVEQVSRLEIAEICRYFGVPCTMVDYRGPSLDD